MGSENKICFLFHSTHPRRVWRIVLVSLILVQTVSIHTPTKGVTYVNGKFFCHTIVSIHTPTKGVTKPFYFPSACLSVSIHTPTKGVTHTPHLSPHGREFQSTHPRRVWQQDRQYFYNEFKFQSTHPRRVWRQSNAKSVATMLFQSTHPRRVWHLYSPFKPCLLSFNPHTHEGCDSQVCKYVQLPVCFNPHTHEGCDPNRRSARTFFQVSIHTPTKGVTLLIALLAKVWRFNPHTHEGCDSKRRGAILQRKEFQSTHPRRVWHAHLLQWRLGGCFNPHTHEGCDAPMAQLVKATGVSIHTPTKGVTSDGPDGLE